MISEIAWLMEAFMEEDQIKLRTKIKDRMAEVTESLTNPRIFVPASSNFTTPSQEPGCSVMASQSPSMQRIMAQNPDLISPVKVAPPVTPAAAQALAARQALIEGANKKPESGRTSPRKV